MQITDKQKRIILIVLGIIIVLLILLLALRGCGAKEFEITFDTNGGSNISNLTIKKEGKITKPEDPTKEGYIFEGWYYDGKEFDFNTEVTEDMKLEARWSKVEVTGINLNAQNLTLKPEGIAELEVIFTPEGASSELVWESSDTSIVTVSENGELKALKDGEATITVTTKDGKYSATCKIKVEDDAVAVTSVSISGDKEVTVGSTIKLTANIKPKDASNKEVVWKSSDKKIATVDSKGNVKGLKPGKVKITVTTVDGEKEATKEITVKEKSANNSSNETPSTQTPTTPSKPSTGENNGSETMTDVKVTGVTLSGANSVNVKSTIQLTVKINPNDATNKKYTCTGDNSSVATVTSDCKVTGKDDGEVTVTVTTEDGKHTATHKVTVKSTYKLILTRNYNDYNVLVGYGVKVYRNGSSWNDYYSFTLNGEYLSFDNDYALSTELPEGLKSIVINLKNGKTATASVEYK